MIDFPTWSRIINNVLPESLLDHVYVTDPTMFTGVHSIKPCFGDHLLVTLSVLGSKQTLINNECSTFDNLSLINHFNQSRS